MLEDELVTTGRFEELPVSVVQVERTECDCCGGYWNWTEQRFGQM